jgi:antitoxin ParD1/3/4
MAEGVNVRLTGPLRQFVEFRIGPQGLYANVSEYVRDLIRRDFEREEARRWAWLKEQVQPGLEADESDFVDLDAQEIIAEARRELKADEP